MACSTYLMPVTRVHLRTCHIRPDSIGKWARSGRACSRHKTVAEVGAEVHSGFSIPRGIDSSG